MYHRTRRKDGLGLLDVLLSGALIWNVLQECYLTLSFSFDIWCQALQPEDLSVETETIMPPLDVIMVRG